MVAHLVQTLDVSSKDSPFRKPVSEVESEPTSRLSAQSSKYYDICEESMQYFDGVRAFSG